MKATVRSDRWGFYIRSENRIYRPQPNHEETRKFKEFDRIIPGVMTPLVTGVVLNQKVNVRSKAYLTTSVFFPDPMGTGQERQEIWSDHGAYTPETENAWFACEWDLDDDALRRKQGLLERQAGELLSGLRKLLGF